MQRLTVRACVDIRSVSPARTGVGNYVLSLLEAMARVAPGEPPMLLGRPQNLACLAGPPPGGAIAARFAQESHPWGDLWQHLALPGVLRRAGVDVFHGPAMTAPYHGRVPTVVTVHDLVPFTHAHTVPAKYAAYMRWHLRRLAKGRARFIVPSQATAADMEAVLGLGPDRVTVIHEAAGGEFRPVKDDTILQRVRARYGLDGPFVLYVGNIEPRKNLPRLVKAFLAASDKAMPGCRLVITGQKAWLHQRLMAELGPAADDGRLVFTGYVPGEDLPPLMSLCLAFAFPTLHEGFGLPALEALACGAPVLASACGALPEVVGEAALLVDPLSEEAIAHGLARLMEDADLRRGLASAAARQAARFSWDTAARRTLMAYRRAAG